MFTNLVLVVITASFSVFITYHADKIKCAYNARKSRKNSKLNEYIRLEIERQLKEILNDN
jgi:cell division protein FtsL